jgi:hypothetical protein
LTICSGFAHSIVANRARFSSLSFAAVVAVARARSVVVVARARSVAEVVDSTVAERVRVFAARVVVSAATVSSSVVVTAAAWIAAAATIELELELWLIVAAKDAVLDPEWDDEAEEATVLFGEVLLTPLNPGALVRESGVCQGRNEDKAHPRVKRWRAGRRPGGE